MQEFVTKQKPYKDFDNLSFSDKQNLVDAFVWLIEEDRKQNPELYQIKKTQNND